VQNKRCHPVLIPGAIGNTIGHQKSPFANHVVLS
jgi:hypothetical protein